VKVCKTTPDNGLVQYIGTASPGYSPHSVAIFGCNNGYNIIGPRYATCGADGSWSDEEPVCLLPDPGCVDLSDPENGDIAFSIDTAAPFDLGTIAEFSCYPGYELVESENTITCEAGVPNDWSGPPRTCQGLLLLMYDYQC